MHQTGENFLDLCLLALKSWPQQEQISKQIAHSLGGMEVFLQINRETNIFP